MGEEKKNMPTINDQYERLIKARNFHYENLNKWLITFYAIIGALFLAFYTLYSKDAKMVVEIIVAVVGYVVSIAALLSIKGYFYWEYNWIEKLYRFEKNILGLKGDEQVYSSIINKEKHDVPWCPVDSANVSTTKVALFVTFGVAVAWGFIIGILCFKMNFSVCTILISLGASILATFVIMVFGAWLFNSELGGLDELPDSKDNHKTSYAKAIFITVVISIAIGTLFVSWGYFEGGKQPHESTISQFEPNTRSTLYSIEQGDSIQHMVEINAVNQQGKLSPFLEGALASAVGSLVVIFLLFWIVRPRIIIDKKYIVQPDGTLTFCFRGYTIFKSVNVHVQVKAVIENGTNETEGNINLVDNYVASLGGIFGRENDRVIGIHTKEPIKSIPKHLRVIVSAQHSVSGITAVAIRDIESQD